MTIYNKRPELDPLSDVNPDMTTKKALKRRKKIKIKTPGFYSEKKDNAITRYTPVYAMVDFQGESGVENAMSDNIRIFGVVIRKHCAVVSVASDYTTLFLEIPANVEQASPLRDPSLPKDTALEYALELEMKLREMVEGDMYICMGLGENEWATPDICEISFPSHELAMMAKDNIEAR